MSGRRYLVLMGPPGAGKGTQASRVAEAGGLCKISTGDLLREAVAAGTELGRRAERTMKAGELVSDDVILGLVDEVLDRPDCARGAVFDGFPRTVDQARGLERLLTERGETLDQVLIIEVPEGEIVRRLSGRRVCKKCGKLYHISFDPSQQEGVCDACGGELVQRPDDQPETIANRLRVYADETAPVREYYAATTGVTAIDGDQPMGAVAEAIRRELQPADAEG
jgi:adenylate kinase